MKDERRTKKQLIAELALLRQRVAQLEVAETERKAAEEALRIRDWAVRSSLSAIALADLAGYLTYVNPSFLKLWGYNDEKEVLGRPAVEFWQLEEKAAEVVEALRDSGSSVGELIAMRKDGSLFDVQLVASMVTDEAGKPVCMTASFIDVTEHKRAEEKLRAEKEFSENVLDALVDTVFVFDPNTGRPLRWNKIFNEISGCSDEEIASRKAPDGWYSEEDLKRAEAATENVFREGRGTVEMSLITKDGRMIPTEYTGSLIRDADGKPQYLIAVGRDITERVRSEEERARAEQALEQRAAQLALLNDIGGKIAAVLELSSVLDRATRLVQENFGYHHVALFALDHEREEVVMRTSAGDFAHLFPPGHRLKLGQGMVGWVGRHGERLLANDVGAEPRYVNLYPDAVPTRSELDVPIRVGEETIGVLDVQSPHLDGFNENDVMVMETLADQIAVAIENARLYEAVREELADRKRSDEEIQKLSQYLESVIDNANVWLNVLDENANVVIWNRAAEEISGYSREEVVGHGKIWEWLYPDEEYRNWLIAEVLAIIETGEMVEHFETTIHCKDGQVRTISWNERGLADAEGNPIGSIAVGRDITERKRAEEQLRQQERLAAIGQLAGGIAHDFNNLLTSIMLYAQIVKDKAHLPPDLVLAVGNILSESHRAAELVQQILDFSRRAMIETRPVDLASSIEEIVGVLRRTLPENIQLTLDARAEEYIVKADPIRIQQALMNLATNARDAMPKGGKLRIGLSRVELGPDEGPPVAEMPAGNWVCLTISDTGTGMTEEVRSHLFEPFFTTKEVGEGTGLGLAQVYGIVKQHEGYIGAETEVGRGTTFRIYLPVHESEEAEEVPEEVLAPPEGKGETILLVEDDESIRDAGRGVLESLGYRVLAAADGREALEVYRSAERVDLVITDVVMPEMGGRYLVQELRKATPGLKVLAITGYAIQEGLEVLKEEGFLDVVQKPFDVSTLAQVVWRALNAR